METGEGGGRARAFWGIWSGWGGEIGQYACSEARERPAERGGEGGGFSNEKALGGDRGGCCGSWIPAALWDWEFRAGTWVLPAGWSSAVAQSPSITEHCLNNGLWESRLRLPWRHRDGGAGARVH